LRIAINYKIAVLVAFLTCLGVLAFLGVALAVEPEITSGVSVLDSDLSGLTREKAAEKLLDLEREVVQSTPLVLRHGHRVWQIQPARAGVIIDQEKILDEALQVAQQGPLLQRLKQWRQARTQGVRIPVYVKVDRVCLEQELEKVAAEIEVPPVDAQLKINPDESVEIIPSRDGMAVDLDRVQREIGNVFQHYDTPPVIELPLIKSEPEITTGDLTEMGINGLLASYSTTFNGADSDRAYNIKVAASALDGIFIPAGEVFSFNEMVGPRSSEAGYKNAKVIVDNRFVEGLGGGVCQVSSTLYNAVLLAGLEVLDRRNHTLPVHYVPPGRDATVTFDHIDFLFKNSTEKALHLKALAGPGRITVKIYGHSDYRRQVTIRTRVEETVPFKQVYLRDYSLGRGEVKVKRVGIPGMRVSAERVVRDQQGERVEALPPSYYNPVDQIILAGPGIKPTEALPPADETEIITDPGAGPPDDSPAASGADP